MSTVTSAVLCEPSDSIPASSGETLALELSAAQCRALDAAGGRPIRMIDPRTGAVHVLLPADAFARLEQAAADLVEARLEAEWLERTHGRSC